VQEWARVAAEQEGVLSRGQLTGLGWTTRQVSRLTRDWQRLHAGVYLTRPGPVPDRSRVWAAVLRAGTGAVAGAQCSLWLAQVREHLPAVPDVCVPADRHVVCDDLRVTRRAGLERLAHLGLSPPRLRLEEAVLDEVARQGSPGAVIDLVLRVTQRRLTTACRLADRLEQRRAQPWRGLLHDVLGDVVAGVQSPLERRYRRDVEIRHGLPAGERNVPERDGLSVRYRDVRYRRYHLVVELDGAEAHPDDERFRDRGRDNRLTVASDAGLRYGWREIVTVPCDVAGEVALMLARGGWDGMPRRCGPGCAVQP
jgi:hypothetical protein